MVSTVIAVQQRRTAETIRLPETKPTPVNSIGSAVLHVLLIEDNTGDVLMVREAIRTSPTKADVVIAYDGEQALRFLTEFKFKPDLIILDLNVPKFNGLQTSSNAVWSTSGQIRELAISLADGTKLQSDTQSRFLNRNAHKATSPRP